MTFLAQTCTFLAATWLDSCLYSYLKIYYKTPHAFVLFQLKSLHDFSNAKALCKFNFYNISKHVMTKIKSMHICMDLIVVCGINLLNAFVSKPSTFHVSAPKNEWDIMLGYTKQKGNISLLFITFSLRQVLLENNISGYFCIGNFLAKMTTKRYVILSLSSSFTFCRALNGDISLHLFLLCIFSAFNENVNSARNLTCVKISRYTIYKYSELGCEKHGHILK